MLTISLDLFSENSLQGYVTVVGEQERHSKVSWTRRLRGPLPSPENLQEASLPRPSSCILSSVKAVTICFIFMGVCFGSINQSVCLLLRSRWYTDSVCHWFLTGTSTASFAYSSCTFLTTQSEVPEEINLAGQWASAITLLQKPACWTPKKHERKAKGHTTAWGW